MERCVPYIAKNASDDICKRYDSCLGDFNFIIEVPHRKRLLLTAVMDRFRKKYYLTRDTHYEFDAFEAKAIVSTINETAVEDKNAFITKIVNVLLKILKKDWAENDMSITKRTTGVSLSDAKSYKKYGVSHLSTQYAFALSGTKLEQGDRFDMMDMQGDINLTDTKPDIVRIRNLDGKEFAKQVGSWKDAAHFILSNIYMNNPKILLNDSRNFTTNEKTSQLVHVGYLNLRYAMKVIETQMTLCDLYCDI